MTMGLPYVSYYTTTSPCLTTTDRCLLSNSSFTYLPHCFSEDWGAVLSLPTISSPALIADMIHSGLPVSQAFSPQLNTFFCDGFPMLNWIHPTDHFVRVHGNTSGWANVWNSNSRIPPFPCSRSCIAPTISRRSSKILPNVIGYKCDLFVGI